MRVRPPSQLLRLKRSVELFTGPDGDLYLLRLGLGDDQVIEGPTPEQRALLEELARGFTEERSLLERHGSVARDSLDQLLELDLIETRTSPRLISELDAERYDRQLIYLADLVAPGTSADVLQRRLADSRVLVVGCGGLGSWTACGLSLSGVGSLTLVDDDSVELSNLSRQLLFDPAEIGHAKGNVAAARLRGHNPGLEVDVVLRRISAAADLADVVAGGAFDLIVSTGDWPPHDLPRWVNEVAYEHGVPWIGAGQFPPRLRLGPLVVPGETSCHACLESWARAESSLYEQVASFRGSQSLPDASTGPVSGAIGSLLANEVVHFLVGAEPASLGRALMLDLASFESERQEIPVDPECAVCGCLEPAALRPSPRPRRPARARV